MELPLDGVRVVDLADVKGEACGRFLADLGAEVIRVEPPGGARSRRLPPFAGGKSLFFATHNANKRGVVLDPGSPDGRGRLLELVETADILLESARPGTLERLGLGPDDLLARNPQLVVTSITDFGQTGPYRDWLGTDWVVGAMSGILDRSGIPGLPPLVPPGGMAYETSAMQAAWATLVAYRNRLRTGAGDHVDVSILEAAGQTMDPDWSAVPPSRPGIWVPPYGRVRSGLYPVLPCADGFVRIVVLAPWQWRSLRAWLGEPEELQDPALDTVPGRQAAEERLNEICAEFFRDRTRHELCEEAQARGIALGPILGIGEVLDNEQFAARGAFVDAEVAPGLRGRLPAGCVEVDGERLGFRRRAPEPGELDEGFGPREQPRPPATLSGNGAAGPLAGIRIVDFGAIVIGNEVGRLYADLGAEVIKIENRAFPDAARAVTGFEMNPIFAAGGRNKKSFGVNLRTPEGVDILKRLVATADVVSENFKPGTLESLGLGYDVLRGVKPDLVFVSSNAVGATGPWRGWLGYGPIVRSVSGITSLWRYPEDEGIHCDQTTIYPDHYAARIVATAALAALLRRDRTGEGARVDCAQAEATLYQLADVLLAASLGDERVCDPAGNRSDRGVPWGIYPCRGEDAWCAVTVEDDEQWSRLARELPPWAADPGLATLDGRLRRRDEIEEALSRWTGALPPREAMERLQRAGVPAGMMMGAADREQDPHLREREYRRHVEQPALGTIPMENAPFRSRALRSIPLRPAPFHGQHTRELCATVLGLDDAEVDRLIDAGVLEEPLPEHRLAAGAAAT